MGTWRKSFRPSGAIFFIKIVAMEKNNKEEQTSGELEAPAFIPATASDRCDRRLPHEIAAVILVAAYEVVIKKLECEQKLGR
jgi:hypothetical protein